MLIRKFAKQDLFQVLQLCCEVREHHIDLLNGYFTKQDDELEQLEFLQSLHDDNIIALVAEDNNNKIYGYLLAQRKFAPYLIGSNVVHIANFGVSKAKRKSGIGKKLMDELLKICKTNEIDEIRLGVYNKNIDALKFYEKYGFEPFEQRMKIQIKSN